MSEKRRNNNLPCKITAADVKEPPTGLFSHCMVAGDTIYVSGQHAGTDQGVIGRGSMLAQTREAFRRVIALVCAAGGSASSVIKLTIFVTDMARRNEVSEARCEIFRDPFPCSTLVGVSALATPDLLVEIEAVAIRHGGEE